MGSLLGFDARRMARFAVSIFGAKLKRPEAVLIDAVQPARL